MPTPGKVSTCLWFETGGLEAARFYTSLIPNSAIKDAQRFDNMATGEEGGVLVIEFTLDGAPYQILQAHLLLDLLYKYLSWNRYGSDSEDYLLPHHQNPMTKLKGLQLTGQ